LSLLLSAKELLRWPLPWQTPEALSIIGGGDTDTAIRKSRSEREDVLYFHRRRRVSGIAGGKTLPGIAALEKSRV